jgi:hypothetical protein
MGGWGKTLSLGTKKEVSPKIAAYNQTRYGITLNQELGDNRLKNNRSAKNNHKSLDSNHGIYGLYIMRYLQTLHV